MIVVACEFSGRVRDALIAQGLDAVSCDLLPTEAPGPHVQGDVLELLAHPPRPVTAVIAFPPCTYLARSGIHWNKRDPSRNARTDEALNFVRALWDSTYRVAIENPVGVLSTRWQRPTQYVQPWEHGEPVSKKTCLWLRGLPKLLPTGTVDPGGSYALDYRGPHGEERQRARSRTFVGIARAMAEQWGPLLSVEESRYKGL